MNGLLFGLPVVRSGPVLRTSTAFPVGEIEVAVVVLVVVVVCVSTEVGARQSNSLQGQPAEQFS